MWQAETETRMGDRRKAREQRYVENADSSVSAHLAQTRHAPRLTPHRAQDLVRAQQITTPHNHHMLPESSPTAMLSSSRIPSMSASGHRPSQARGTAAQYHSLDASTAPVQSSHLSFHTPPRTPREPRPRISSHHRLSGSARQKVEDVNSVASSRAKQHGFPSVSTPPPSEQRFRTPSHPVSYQHEPSTATRPGMAHWRGDLSETLLPPGNESPQMDSAVARGTEAFVKMEEAQLLEAEDRLRAQEDIRKLLKMPEIEIPPEQRADTPMQMSCKLMEHQKVALKWLKDQEKNRHKRGGLLAGTCEKTCVSNLPCRNRTVCARTS